MSPNRIRVLIVDDFADTRESIAKLLYFERDIEVAGSAGDAQQGIQMAKDIRPDVILMDINMPGMDGIAATEAILAAVPECEVIMMSVQGEPDFLRRAMLAGAREYLVKPFTGDELAGSIKHVYELAAEKRARLAAIKTAAPQPAPQPALAHPTAQTVAVFSPKGGVGRTSIAINLAIGLALATGKKVALVDCNLLFGDVAIMLNLNTNKTIADLIPNVHALDPDLLNSVLVGHSSGIQVLLAPPRPELAELINGEHIRAIMNQLRACYDYVVVDTVPSFDDATLSVLDLSDVILLLTTLEMPAIKNVKLFLEVAEALHYPHEKVKLVVNCTDSTLGISAKDIEENIRFKVSATVANATQLMANATNQGVPLLVSHPESVIARDILSIVGLVVTEADMSAAEERIAGMTGGSRGSRAAPASGRLRLRSLVPFASRKGAS